MLHCTYIEITVSILRSLHI